MPKVMSAKTLIPIVARKVILVICRLFIARKARELLYHEEWV